MACTRIMYFSAFHDIRENDFKITKMPTMICRHFFISSAVVFSRVFRRQDVVLQFQINIHLLQRKHSGMKQSPPLEY